MNKWNKVILVSFIIIFIEVIATAIIMFPYHNKNRMFASIDKGDWSKTLSYYEELSDENKAEVVTYLDDYAAYVCGRYIDGTRTYDQTIASLDAINAIPEAKEIAKTYMKDLNHNQFKVIIDKLFTATLTTNSQAAFEAQLDITSIQQRMDTETRENVLVEELNEKYQQFLNEELTRENMDVFSIMVRNLSYYNAHNYSDVILSNTGYVVEYRTKYTELTGKLESLEYIEVMNGCRAVNIDPKDTVYAQKYTELYTKAYDDGKIHYKDELLKLIDEQNKEGVVKLMTKIEEAYGDGFDLSFATSALKEGWMNGYLEIAPNILNILSEDLLKSETGKYILENEFIELAPDAGLLYDIDKDDKPELFLFNKNQLENDYIGCFIYSSGDNGAKYLGYVNVINFCSDSNIIAYPTNFTASQGEAYSLLSYTDGSLIEVSHCQKINDKYYVNHAETTDAQYLSTYSSILSHANEVLISRSDYSEIDNLDNYILGY